LVARFGLGRKEAAVSVERTREIMIRYWDSGHQDVSMMADDKPELPRRARVTHQWTDAEGRRTGQRIPDSG
jgi:hypothetical protein